VRASPPEIEIFSTPEALADHVAAWIAHLARFRKKNFSVALSGGSTPCLLYRVLAGHSEFPWPRVHWFWGDERFVAPSDEMSNFHMAQETLLSHAPVPADNIHAIPTMGLSLADAARRYEANLQHYYGATTLDPQRPLFDVALLGLGVDGHTASLFPGSSALAERVRWTAAVGDQNPERITLTYPALESSAHAVFLVTGTEKRKVLRDLLQGNVDLPAGRLRPVGELRFFVDAAAAA
jgi:6-phosphogluconolactonase